MLKPPRPPALKAGGQKKAPRPPAPPESQTGRLLAELAQMLILEVLALSEAGRTGALETEKILQLGRAIKDLVSAEKLSTERDLKLREAERQRLLSEASPAVGPADGLSPEGQALLRDRLLGIKR